MKLSVAIVLGSETDKEALEKSGMLKILKDNLVGYDVYVCSAHRNEEALSEYCEEMVKRGVRVFVAMAGLSAALAGSIVAKIYGTRPVLAVGLSSGTILTDMAALLATTMVPKFTPVMTVGMDKHGLINAALCAMQILAVGDDEMFIRYQEYMRSQTPQPKHLDL